MAGAVSRYKPLSNWILCRLHHCCVEAQAFQTYSRSLVFTGKASMPKTLGRTEGGHPAMPASGKPQEPYRGKAVQILKAEDLYPNVAARSRTMPVPQERRVAYRFNYL